MRFFHFMPENPGVIFGKINMNLHQSYCQSFTFRILFIFSNIIQILEMSFTFKRQQKCIREMLGHSSLATTLSYIYNPLTDAETYDLISKALQARQATVYNCLLIFRHTQIAETPYLSRFPLLSNELLTGIGHTVKSIFSA